MGGAGVGGLRLRAVVVGNGRGTRLAGAGGHVLDHRVQQVAHALAVLGRDLEHGLEAQLIELERARLAPAGRPSC